MLLSMWGVDGADGANGANGEESGVQGGELLTAKG